VLARYVGWGALANSIFGDHPAPEWRNTAGSVRQLLTDDEYESARASELDSNTAFTAGCGRDGIGRVVPKNI